MIVYNAPWGRLKDKKVGKCVNTRGERQTGRERQRETDRQRDRDRQTDRDREKERGSMFTILIHNVCTHVCILCSL